ncbi:hypothetical protein HZS_226 [Henneguya salminicola]|nr:hypothetical protein HZS_226 [Henneguya salminicola]
MSVHGIYLEKISREFLHVNSTVSTGLFFRCLTFYSFSCIIFGGFVNLISKKPIVIDLKKNELFYGSLYYSFSSILSFGSLGFVNYPTHIIVKSLKPLFVIICLMVGVSHKLKIDQLLCGIIISLGILLFSGLNSGKIYGNTFRIGDILLPLSLAFDGLSSVIQDKMKKMLIFDEAQYMISANIFTFVFSCFISFFFALNRSQHSSVSSDLTFNTFMYIISGIFSQYSNFIIVRNFGSLVGSVIATIRKFISVFISVRIFNHIFCLRQWMGMTLVMIGSLYIIVNEI